MGFRLKEVLQAEGKMNWPDRMLITDSQRVKRSDQMEKVLRYEPGLEIGESKRTIQYQ